MVDPADFFADASIQDPYPLYRRLRESGGVHRVGDSGYYLISTWAAASDAANRPQDFSSNLTAPITYSADRGVVPLTMGGVGGPTHILATADDPVHALHRKLMLGQFTAKRVRALEPLIAEVFDKLWAAGYSGDSLEWMAAVANQLPMTIVCRLIGVPDGDAGRLAEWGYASTQLLDGVVSDEQVASSLGALGELNTYLVEQLRIAASAPRDDLLGVLATACADGTLDGFAAQMILISLFSAGGESTASLLGTTVATLATSPELQEQVRARPELLGAFTEEMLRLEPPFRAHHRHVLHDTELAGVALPADSRILLLWGAANRDPDHFEAPDEFRLDRAISKGHLTFGKGLHFCLGAPLARLEATTVLRMLLERTARFEAVEVGPWLPSVLARRHETVQLSVRCL